MSDTLADFLNEVGADQDMIQQALRISISERTNDVTRREMLVELRTEATSAADLDALLARLGRDSAALEQAALTYFEHLWRDDTQRAPVRAAFEHAKARLPVVETAILAVVAMYAMHLVTTGGVLEVTTRRMADGSYETTRKNEPFVPLVASVARLLTKQN